MTTSSDLAARILINYEASLKCDGKDTLAERLDAMRRTVEALRLMEGGHVVMIAQLPLTLNVATS